MERFPYHHDLGLAVSLEELHAHVTRERGSRGTYRP